MRRLARALAAGAWAFLHGAVLLWTGVTVLHLARALAGALEPLPAPSPAWTWAAAGAVGLIARWWGARRG